ncbi:MAG: sulfatase [Candidatus Alcyoniella australis]|nr:sulfatase [Candidatus Alcyoniella australis]
MSARGFDNAPARVASAGLLIGSLIGVGRGLLRSARNDYFNQGLIHNALAEVLTNWARIGIYALIASLLLGLCYVVARLIARKHAGAAALAVCGALLCWGLLLALVDGILREATPGSLSMLSTIYFSKLETATLGVQLGQAFAWCAALLLPTALIALLLRLLARLLPTPLQLFDRAWAALSRFIAVLSPPYLVLGLLACLIVLPQLALMLRPDPQRVSHAQPLNVVLISLDTVRADHMSLYGYDRPTTPNIDRLAQTALVFDQAISQAPWTLPSHATLFTGLFPSVHGANTYHSRIVPELTLLPEVFRESGWATMAVTSHILLSDSFGFDQGWDIFHFLGEPGAAEVTDAALNLIQGRDQPFMLFAHYFDAHAPYFPPPPYDALFDADYQGEINGSVEQLQRSDLGPRDVEHLIALYDAEIRLLDDEVGRLLEALFARPDADRTLVVLLADHGEAFGEHGSFEHHTLHDEVLHVPLIIWPPHSAPIDTTPRRVDHAVGTVNLAQTVAGWAGPTMPAGQGRDLSPLLGSSAAQSVWPIFAEESAAVDRQGLAERAVRYQGVKLIEHGEDCELYRLELDPLEQHNRCADDEVFAEYRQMLADAQTVHSLARDELLQQGLLSDAQFQPDQRAQERLKALGYLQ